MRYAGLTLWALILIGIFIWASGLVSCQELKPEAKPIRVEQRRPRPKVTEEQLAGLRARAYVYVPQEWLAGPTVIIIPDSSPGSFWIPGRYLTPRGPVHYPAELRPYYFVNPKPQTRGHYDASRTDQRTRK